MLLQRTAANRAFLDALGQNRRPQNPCLSVFREKQRKEGRYSSSGIYCSALIDSWAVSGRFDIAPVPERTAPNRGRVVQQATLCTRKRIETTRFAASQIAATPREAI